MTQQLSTLGNLKGRLMLPADDPIALALVEAIQTGNLDSLRELLRHQPQLAGARITDKKGAARTLLHVVTDWPGFFPNGPAMATALMRACCDPNAPFEGGWHRETPLHWAASSDEI
jgi:hypothetical protein